MRQLINLEHLRKEINLNKSLMAFHRLQTLPFYNGKYSLWWEDSGQELERQFNTLVDRGYKLKY